jgi:hypothetical protein
MARKQNKVSDEVVVTPTTEAPVRKTKTELDRNMLVTVMNNTHGIFTYTSKKTGATWRLEGYGTTDEMELGELHSMKASAGRILNEPWLIVLDDDVVDYLGLTSVYKNVMRPEEVERFFNLSTEKMEEILKKAPSGVKTLIVAKAQDMITKGELDSMAKKALLEKMFNLDLEV